MCKFVSTQHGWNFCVFLILANRLLKTFLRKNVYFARIEKDSSFAVPRHVYLNALLPTSSKNEHHTLTVH